MNILFYEMCIKLDHISCEISVLNLLFGAVITEIASCECKDFGVNILL